MNARQQLIKEWQGLKQRMPMYFRDNGTPPDIPYYEQEFDILNRLKAAGLEQIPGEQITVSELIVATRKSLERLRSMPSR